MRCSLRLILALTVFLSLPAFSAAAPHVSAIDAAEIESIVLTTSPAFGPAEEMVDTEKTLRPDDALITLLYAQGFFDMPEYLDTGVMDGHFTWITVYALNGESKRVGGLVAEEFGPEGFIVIYEAVVRAMQGIQRPAVESIVHTESEANKNAPVFIHSPGNSANLGWVLEGIRGEIYVGSEYGLSRLEPDGEILALGNAYGLTGCGGYLMFCTDEGLFATDAAHGATSIQRLFDGRIGRTASVNDHLYFDSGANLYRVDSGAPLAPGEVGIPFDIQIVVCGGVSDPARTDYALAFHGEWALGADSFFTGYSFDGYRRECLWSRTFLNGQSQGAGVFLVDTDLLNPFVSDEHLYFIPVLPYGSQAPWKRPNPGVYQMDLDKAPVWLSHSEHSFPAECLVQGNVRSFTLFGDMLVCAGDLGEGPGLYTADVAVGQIKRIHTGEVFAPNTTSEHIWFRTKAPKGRDDANSPRYNYWQIRFDGTELTNLDGLLQ